MPLSFPLAPFKHVPLDGIVVTAVLGVMEVNKKYHPQSQDRQQRNDDREENHRPSAWAMFAFALDTQERSFIFSDS